MCFVAVTITRVTITSARFSLVLLPVSSFCVDAVVLSVVATDNFFPSLSTTILQPGMLYGALN